MQIIRSDRFIVQLQNILEYIAKDKIAASIEFRKKLDKEIDDLINFPYKYRQSHYYEDKDIRDMIFRGYTVIYRVNSGANLIEILTIFNKNLPPKE